jgi:hypothetical protein
MLGLGDIYPRYAPGVVVLGDGSFDLSNFVQNKRDTDFTIVNVFFFDTCGGLS